MSHSCPTAEDLKLCRRDLLPEGDLRALQATHLDSSALVASFPNETARQSTAYCFEHGRSFLGFLAAATAVAELDQKNHERSSLQNCVSTWHQRWALASCSHEFI